MVKSARSSMFRKFEVYITSLPHLRFLKHTASIRIISRPQHVVKMFSTTYFCELRFSDMKHAKNTLLSSMTNNHISVVKEKICIFGSTRNLIRHLISPNRDDLSYSTRTFISGQQDWMSCQTHSLWLENADQCRHHIGRFSIAMLFSWTMSPSADISLRL